MISSSSGLRFHSARSCGPVQTACRTPTTAPTECTAGAGWSAAKPAHVEPMTLYLAGLRRMSRSASIPSFQTPRDPGPHQVTGAASSGANPSMKYLPAACDSVMNSAQFLRLGVVVLVAVAVHIPARGHPARMRLLIRKRHAERTREEIRGRAVEFPSVRPIPARGAAVRSPCDGLAGCNRSPPLPFHHPTGNRPPPDTPSSRASAYQSDASGWPCRSSLLTMHVIQSTTSVAALLQAREERRRVGIPRLVTENRCSGCSGLSIRMVRTGMSPSIPRKGLKPRPRC